MNPNLKTQKMEYSNFLKSLMAFKKISEDVSELHDIGVDLMEGKFRILGNVVSLFESNIEESYGEEGLDWVNWFIYESEYGQKDWSTAPLYSEDGKLIKEAGEVRHGAHDENGNPICYSYESLWEYLESNHKSK